MRREKKTKHKSKNRDNRKKVSSKNHTSKAKSSSRSNRVRKKRAAQQRKYRIRRTILAILLVFLIILIFKLISSAINSYKVMGYPDFRDEVLDDMGNEVFVSSSEGRSLSTAEKITDFDDLYKTVERNYAVDELNKENFDKFLEEYNTYRKKVYSSKTDQEYLKLSLIHI